MLVSCACVAFSVSVGVGDARDNAAAAASRVCVQKIDFSID